MHMKRRLFHLIVICFAIVASGIVQAQQRVVPDNRSQVMLSFGPLVERTAPAVVNIYTQRLVQIAKLVRYSTTHSFAAFLAIWDSGLTSNDNNKPIHLDQGSLCGLTA